MARVSGRLPADLVEVAGASRFDLSRPTETAIHRSVDSRGLDRWLEQAAALPPTEIDQTIVNEAVSAARGELELGQRSAVPRRLNNL